MEETNQTSSEGNSGGNMNNDSGENMGKTWWILLAIAIVIVFVMLAIQPESRQGEENTGEQANVEGSPQEIVEGFYAFWLTYYDEQGESPVISMAHEDRVEVTDNFSDRVNSVMESFGDRMAFDPITCANSTPADASFQMGEVTDDTARVMVDLTFTETVDRQIAVDLVPQDNQWRIDAVRCNP